MGRKQIAVAQKKKPRNTTKPKGLQGRRRLSDRHRRGLRTVRDNLGKLAATAAGAATVAAMSPETGPGVVNAAILATLFGTLGTVFTIGIDAAVAARADAARRFLDEVTRRYRQAGVTESEVKGLLEAHAERPATREAIFEAARRLMDAAAPEVAVPMGTLFAEYTADERPPDAFYRGVMRCLADLSSEEYATFREVIIAWAGVATETTLPQIVWNPGFEETDGPIEVKAGVIQNGQWKEIELGHWLQADRVITLLELHGLAQRTGQRANRTDVSKVLTHHGHLWTDPVQMRKAALLRLARLLR